MYRPDNTRNGFWIILALCIFPIEIALLYLCSIDVLSLPLWICVRTPIIALIGFCLYRAHKRGEDLRYPVILILGVFGAGPFGVGGFLFFSLVRPLFSLFATPPKEWFEGLFPVQHQTAFATIYQRVSSHWDDYGNLNEVSSFNDIFACGTIAQKQAVLDAIVKDFQPVYAPVLLRALDDPENTIRIHAGAIIAKIDFDFEKDLIKLTRTQKLAPNDPSLILDLAEHYDTYASLGILDAVRKKEIGEKGIRFYRLYLQSHPEDRQVLYAIGGLLYRMRDFREFAAWYEEYKAKYKIIPDIIRTWYMEALYQLQRFEELAEITRGY